MFLPWDAGECPDRDLRRKAWTPGQAPGAGAPERGKNMARTGFQIRAMANKTQRANELLAWIKEKELSQGSKAFENIIKPFAREKQCPLFEVWQAWDLLKEAKRRLPRPGWRWEVVDFEPVFIDDEGNLADW